MRKVKLLLIAAILTIVSVFGMAPARAMTCDRGIDEVCRAAATVICKVLAKGQPCLM